MNKSGTEPQRVRTKYLHLQKNSVIVKQGDGVKKGEQIACMGSTGGSTTPHLHFTVLILKGKEWTPVDPQIYVYKRKNLNEKS